MLVGEAGEVEIEPLQVDAKVERLAEPLRRVPRVLRVEGDAEERELLDATEDGACRLLVLFKHLHPVGAVGETALLEEFLHPLGRCRQPAKCCTLLAEIDDEGPTRLLKAERLAELRRAPFVRRPAAAVVRANCTERFRQLLGQLGEQNDRRLGVRVPQVHRVLECEFRRLGLRLRSAVAVALGRAPLVLGTLLFGYELGLGPQLVILLKEGGPVEEDAHVAEAVGLAHAEQPRAAQHAEAWEEGLQPCAQQQQLLAVAVRVPRFQPATASARGDMRTV